MPLDLQVLSPNEKHNMPENKGERGIPHTPSESVMKGMDAHGFELEYQRQSGRTSREG